MKTFFIKHFLILLLFVFIPVSAKSQDPVRQTKKRTFYSMWLEKRKAAATRKSDKKKWKEERKTTRITKRNVKKHHKRLQTKGTLKSMRKLRKQSKNTRD
jgi:hypothetical protein